MGVVYIERMEKCGGFEVKSEFVDDQLEESETGVNWFVFSRNMETSNERKRAKLEWPRILVL